MSRGRLAHPPLPMRDGVSASCVGLPTEDHWPTIADFLIARFTAIAPEAWMRRIRDGEVVDEHGVPVTPERRYQAPLRVFYYRALDTEPAIPFEEQVLYRDEHLLVVDKPHFVPVTPTGKYLHQSLLVRLKRKLGIEALSPLHRIDRSTAGLLLFSLRPETRGAYQTMFAQRTVHKEYEAIVPLPGGEAAAAALPSVYRSRLVDDAHFMQVKEAPGEPNSETGIAVLKVFDGLAHLALSPVTGRRHQLRVHCMALGMPIVNDPFYPVLTPVDTDDFERPLQLLARSIAFTDPVTGEPRRFDSQLRLLLAPR
jgi:tRNA pseudouridine32 synthase / 23S rRNA pseudouridine746 synthase